MIAISQSGETADTIGALKEVKTKKILTLGIVNAVGSTISRKTDAGIYNRAGPEISVASTKAFISQAIVLALLTLSLARKKTMNLSEGKELVSEIKNLHGKAGQILSGQRNIENIAKKYFKYKNFIYLGRKYNFPIALEGALKLKEVSYIHAEGYAGGELKHGPIALVDKDFPIFCIATKGSSYSKMLSNIEEIKARGGKVICIATSGDRKISKIADKTILVKTNEELVKSRLKDKSLLNRRKYQRETERADYIVNNNSDLSSLQKKAEKIWKELNE